MATKSHDREHEHDSKKCCFEDWENDLKDVKNKLKMSQCRKTGISNKNSNAITWYVKLNMYWESMRHTEELLDDVAVQLELFIDQSELICNNIECSRMAIQILFCKLKKVFECTDKLRECLIDFFMKVDCLSDENINEKSSFIYACLKSLLDKLEVAVAKQYELLKKFIDILKCIEELEEAICNEECGVRGNLIYMAEIFTRSGEESVSCDLSRSCEDKVEPKPVIPLNCDPVYIFTSRQRELAESEKKDIKDELDQICKEHEALASCERSLSEAVESSKAAQECK
jgi:hypothetical protein